MSVAWGVEVDRAGETGAVAEARPAAAGLWRVDLVFYQAAVTLPGWLAERYEIEPESAGVFCDPMPCAPVLDDLRRAVGLHTLEAVDVAAASAQFKTAVKSRTVTAGEHPALEQAVTYALQRSLATAFAYERRKVAADMSPLNAAAFALWGLRQHGESDPGAWVI